MYWLHLQQSNGKAIKEAQRQKNNKNADVLNVNDLPVDAKLTFIEHSKIFLLVCDF